LTIPLQNILPFLNAKNIGEFSNEIIENISIDSRSLQNGATTLFFAIKGQNHDAHLYLEELIAKGVRFFVVDNIPEHLAENATFFVVENSLKTLQQTAIGYRKQFTFPFIGITGSNGKTIVKEWLNFLLSPNH
jgi:alanine racemase